MKLAPRVSRADLADRDVLIVVLPLASSLFAAWTHATVVLVICVVLLIIGFIDFTFVTRLHLRPRKPGSKP